MTHSPWRAFPTAEEGVALTRANPKGRLLEFCARARCEPPEIEIERGTTLSGARMTLMVEGQAFESGMHWSADRMLAEQMAARALLDALARTEDEAEPGEWVPDTEEERLRRENPKGVLLERCARLRLTPRFEVRPVVTVEGPGFEASAFIERPGGEEMWGDLRRARQAKTAEQAAAATLLVRLEEETALSPTPGAVGGPGRGGADIRSGARPGCGRAGCPPPGCPPPRPERNRARREPRLWPGRAPG